MVPRKRQDTLQNAVKRFSQPFKSMEEVAVVSMKLDEIVGILLRSPYVQGRLGQGRVTELAAAAPELPSLLREIGEAGFAEAADGASDLLEISRSSVADFGGAEDEVMIANKARERFHRAFVGLLATIDLETR